MALAKLRAVLACAEFDSAQCYPARSRLCAVLANFGCPQIFRKLHMFLFYIHFFKVGLHAVLANIGCPQIFRKFRMFLLDIHFFKVGLHAVLACSESLIS